ncbi:MAG: TonB-dependent receptor [Gammaproteobacteria bacterium]|nr:TonB-dependent receptor [Gammaproteobacteria bacterium]
MKKCTGFTLQTACALAALAFLPPAARAQSLYPIVVTATRIPERADQVAAAISVVSGKELAVRDAADLGAALALVPGVEAPAGGDAGPSSAVPSFLGLHEFDAFLVVVDGVPWGGAFNPGISTLDLNDVERIEILKGAAPVLFGATSFVGVVQAIHYPAGQAANQADIAIGSHGSLRGSASLVLPAPANYRQSLAVDGRSVGFADGREKLGEKHLLYRGAATVGAGTLRVDLNMTFVRDVPPSPQLRAGGSLTALTPIDANFNPADARIDENKYQIAVGYSRPTPWGAWDTLVSVAYSEITDIRGFLHPDLSGAADTQNQRRRIDDDYFDTHLTHRFSGSATLIAGADLLYGHGLQRTLNGNSAYTVPLDGSLPPPASTAMAPNEIGTVDDRRWFSGVYAELDWKPGARWDVAGGLRLNDAREHKKSSDLLPPPPQLATGDVAKTTIRPTGTLGLSYRLWRDGADEAVTYVNYRNSFKPAAIDFGPDYTPDLLSPETAQSAEAGFKGALDHGRFSFQADLFHMDFRNLVVATAAGSLANAAGERLEGVEFESRYRLSPDLTLAASAAYHDARFTHYLFFDGSSGVDVGGRQLTLSPHVLASAGLMYSPPRGFNASLTARYAGRRFLDETNVAPVGGYVVADANLGYGFGRTRVWIEGTNLSNRRPPVTASEFGSQSFYLLPGRMLWLRVGYRWD